jgi:hypothetical protein
MKVLKTGIEADLSWHCETAEFPCRCDMLYFAGDWFCFGVDAIGECLLIEAGDIVYRASMADHPAANVWHLCPACYAKLMASEGHLAR